MQDTPISIPVTENPSSFSAPCPLPTDAFRAMNPSLTKTSHSGTRSGAASIQRGNSQHRTPHSTKSDQKNLPPFSVVLKAGGKTTCAPSGRLREQNRGRGGNNPRPLTAAQAKSLVQERMRAPQGRAHGLSITSRIALSAAKSAVKNTALQKSIKFVTSLNSLLS